MYLKAEGVLEFMSQIVLLFVCFVFFVCLFYSTYCHSLFSHLIRHDGLKYLLYSHCTKTQKNCTNILSIAELFI